MLVKTLELSSEQYQSYLDNLLSGRRAECQQFVQLLLSEGWGMRDLYLKLFRRSLYEVGSLWEHNKISVAAEHLATAVTESLFTLVYPEVFSAEPNGKRVVVSCVANEYHQIGAKMIADVCALNGWDSYFLGANTPGTALIDLVENVEPHLLGLSMSIYFNLPSLLALIEQIRVRFPELPIIAGGQAFRWGGADAVQAYPGVTHISSFAELETLLQTEFLDVG